MNWLKAKKIEEIMKEIISIPSISGVKNEDIMADKIKEIIGRIEYFQNNKDKLSLNKIKNDQLDRSFVTALLKNKSSKTIILTGHFDVVNVDGYGKYKDLAFSPEKLTKTYRKELMKQSIKDSLKKDLKDDNYLFGRGTADMKGGLAVQIALLQYFSKLKNFDKNILFLAVPDEENLSQGMISAVPYLTKLKDLYNLDYKVVINCEPNFPSYPEDENKYIYTGSIGKSLVLFYCIGKESHAGSPLSGLNANLITSEIINLLEGNVDLTQQLKEIKSPPPTCLKQEDLKNSYSATLPEEAYAYFNYSTIESSSKEILEKMKNIAKKAGINSYKRVKNHRYCYNENTNNNLLKPDVYTYKKLYNSLKKNEKEKFKNQRKKILNNNTLSFQEKGIKIVKVLNNMSDQGNPKIILSFLPPYYPSLVMKKENNKEILKVKRKIIQYAKNKYNVDLISADIFPGISDLSFFNLNDYKNEIEYLKPNLPYTGYNLPLKTMNQLNIPVMNLGVYGKDIHKYTERIEKVYSFHILPKLIIKAIDLVLN